MNALILTQQQSESLIAANDPTSNRRLEPRLLEDGTFLLNADILDDPHFMSGEKSWRAILTQIDRPTPESKTLAEHDAQDLAAKAEKDIPIDEVQ